MSIKRWLKLHKSKQSKHEQYLAYKIYCEEFLSHKRHSRILAKFMPFVKRVCPCGCGDYWLDDLSDTNWLRKVVNLKVYWGALTHSYKITRSIYAVMYSLGSSYSAMRKLWYNNKYILAYKDGVYIRGANLGVPILLLVVSGTCWLITRVFGVLFIGINIVALGAIWLISLITTLLDAAALASFAISSFLGILAGYFLGDDQMLAFVLTLVILVAYHYIIERRRESKLSSQLGRILLHQSGDISPSIVPEREKTYRERLDEKNWRIVLNPCFPIICT